MKGCCRGPRYRRPSVRWEASCRLALSRQGRGSSGLVRDRRGVSGVPGLVAVAGRVVCPHCDARSASAGGSGVYRCRGCRRRVSVTAGTIFHKTRVPLTTWFEAIWLFTSSKAGVSATLYRVLAINSYHTAWTMLAKLRAVLSQNGLEPLTGRVEVDETFIGGVRSGKPGRGAAGKVLVAGGVEIAENGWGRARMAIIADASAASLRGFITANIAVGSTSR